MTSITRQYEISCAHHLPLHEGKCRSPHGHNYIIEITVTGSLHTEGPSTGMVMDFADLDLVANALLSILDHQDLNEVLNPSYQPPTAENICNWLYDSLQQTFVHNNPLSDKWVRRVRVYETKNSYVEVD